MASSSTDLSAWVKKQARHSYRYYPSTLCGSEHDFYEAYFTSVAEYGQKCSVSGGLLQDQCEKIIKYVLDENPSLFYFSNPLYQTITRWFIISKLNKCNTDLH